MILPSGGFVVPAGELPKSISSVTSPRASRITVEPSTALPDCDGGDGIIARSLSGATVATTSGS